MIVDRWDGSSAIEQVLCVGLDGTALYSPAPAGEEFIEAKKSEGASSRSTKVYAVVVSEVVGHVRSPSLSTRSNWEGYVCRAGDAGRVLKFEVQARYSRWSAAGRVVL